MPAPADTARFARQLVLPGIGLEGQDRIAQARVLVLGAGGLGSAVLPILAGAGIGTLGVVDDDVVELSNLPRQILHTTSDLGRRKVDSAVDRLQQLATGTIQPHPVRFTPDNAADLAAGYDLIVDGTDNFETRFLANDIAVAAGIPLVWGAVSQFGGHIGAVVPGAGPDYRDLFPVAPDPSSVITCADGGVLPSVCGVVGSVMASEVLKLVTGLGDPLVGRVTSYDALTGRFREVAFRADPDAPPRPAPPAAPRAGTAAPEEPEMTDQPELSPRELDDLLTDGADIQLVDVREPWEAEIASIPGAKLLPLGTLAGALDELDRTKTVVLYCHHGVRSERARDLLLAAGIPATHLRGGINAWSRTVDPDLPRY